jgi:anion-transporting  ArsA/GET3 family ATPase
MPEKRIVVCLGAGGVGKTTVSAALALGLAARGGKVLVVTIDPAKRLAATLGVEDGPSEPSHGSPRRIDGARFTAEGVPMKGELWAMMLDPKRAFDDIVTRLAHDDREREQILADPIYQQLSAAVAGSNELSAIAKLHELHHEHDFDVIVLDTPPSRNALDFLDAPGRLLGFLEGRALKVFVAPSGITARLFGRSTAVVFAIFARVTGVDMMSDLSRFFRTLSGVIEGFGERTRAVASLLREPSTTFWIVTSPEPEPALEAVFLAERLAERDLACGELVVNRVYTGDGLGESDPEEVQALLEPDLGPSLAARLAGNVGDFDVLVKRDAATIAALSRELEASAPIVVPYMDADTQGLADLAAIAEHLLDRRLVSRR